MSKEWHKGYKEVKNVIHNEIGVTKEEILEVFRQIAKNEIQNIVSENRTFIYEVIREVIRNTLMEVLKDHGYPKIRKNIWDYTNENAFKDFITGVMKEEIVNIMKERFDIKLEINKRES